MNLRTWKGKYYGYIEGENLYSYKGYHIGKLIDGEIYNEAGNYLGELVNDKYLITNLTKKRKQASGFRPSVNRVSRVKMINQVGKVMKVGHEDFPYPKELF